MKVKEAAKLLETTESTIRIGLQQGVFPFGTAFKTNPNNKNFVYIIYPEILKAYARKEDKCQSQSQNV